MEKIDRHITQPIRNIENKLKGMVIKQAADNSLIESFIQIIRQCRRLKDLVDNTSFFEFLSANYKDQVRFKPILALFNLIYSSYTVDKEANIVEIASLIKDIRKEFSQVKSMDDIEIFLYAISTSFRELTYMMDKPKGNIRDLKDILSEIINSDIDVINNSPYLQRVIEAVFNDFQDAKPNTMDAEGSASQQDVLKRNLNVVLDLTSNFSKMPKLNSYLNISTTQGFDDEQNRLFTELVESYTITLINNFGKKLLNPDLIKPIQLDLLKEFCRINRYDLQNQVNFGYLDVKFPYLSFTKTINCTLSGMPAVTSVKKDDIEVQNALCRITYTNKLNVDVKGFRQTYDTLRLPKIKNFLLKIMELDPNLDIVNDYDVIAFYQARNTHFKQNYYRFISVEERLTAVCQGNEINSNFNIMFLNERRLCEPKAIKIFYASRLSRATLQTDMNPVIYVTVDNDEFLEHFIQHVIKIHNLAEGAKDDNKALQEKIIKSCTFYLPSTLETDPEVTLWKNYSSKIALTKQTAISKIYEDLVKISGIDLYDPNDKSTHMYMNCFMDVETSDIAVNGKQFEKSNFETLSKAKTENIKLNTGLTDILNYVMTNFKTTLEMEQAKPEFSSKNDPNSEALWKKLDINPMRLFLPNFFVVRVFEIRKLLELGDELDFDYIEDRINSSTEPLSNKYNIIGLICQKKGNDNNPIFYPVIKESENVYDTKYRGYLNEKEIVADIYKIDREQVHFIIFERRDIQF